MTYATSNCYLRSKDRLITTVGVKDLVVIETEDAILVSHKNETLKIKKIVEEFMLYQRSELIRHKKDMRLGDLRIY
jgi:hypothetical protein